MGLQVSHSIRAERKEKGTLWKKRHFLAPLFHELARQKGCEIVKGNMVRDHVHMLVRIPPKYSVAEVIGYIKVKSAIGVARHHGGRKRNFNGEHFWARGYAVSTVGFEESEVREYSKYQQQLDVPDESGEKGKVD